MMLINETEKKPIPTKCRTIIPNTNNNSNNNYNNERTTFTTSQ